jgi:hypothetical protein
VSGTKRILGSLGAAIVLAAFGILASPQTAVAASIACTTPALIAAIAAVSGGGSVTLASPCIYTLTSADNTTDEGTGLPVITGVVTITGNGTTITRSTVGGTPNFRILDVASTGRVIAPEASASEIAAAVDAALRDNGARAAARRFAATIAALGAGESATDEVEQLGGLAGGAGRSGGARAAGRY